ncbi:unnamed protein product, partial [Brassica rapa]
IVNTAGLCRLVLTKNNQVLGLQLRSKQKHIRIYRSVGRKAIF